MSSKNYAAIDIGSNAVRLLIKKVSRNENTGEDKFSKVLLLSPFIASSPSFRLRCVRARRNLSGKRRENAPFDESVSPSDEDL